MSEYDIEKLNNLTENDITTTDSTVVEEVREGNVQAALLAGLFSCFAVSSVWALISVNTEKQWLYMGLIAGLAVGWFVKIASGGNNSTIGFIAQNEGMTFFQTLGALDFSYFFEIAFLDFDFFSIIIYGLAAVEGWVCGRGLNKD